MGSGVTINFDFFCCLYDPYTINTEWDKSRLTVVGMKNNTIINK